VLRSSLALEERVGVSCQRPTTALLEPLARLLLLASPSSGEDGTCTVKVVSDVQPCS
jgi:hypothetical protein